MQAISLKAAGERKKASGIGRHAAHVEKRPDVVAETRRYIESTPKAGERRSLREMSAELEFAGFLNEFGKSYHPQSIQRMIESDGSPRMKSS